MHIHRLTHPYLPLSNIFQAEEWLLQIRDTEDGNVLLENQKPTMLY